MGETCDLVSNTATALAAAAADEEEAVVAGVEVGREERAREGELGGGDVGRHVSAGRRAREKENALMGKVTHEPEAGSCTYQRGAGMRQLRHIVGDLRYT